VKPDPDPRFWWPNLKKKIMLKKIYLFLIKNCNLLIPRPPERTPKLKKNSSALKREHPTLAIFKKSTLNQGFGSALM
jgi:hypothetical protein